MFEQRSMLALNGQTLAELASATHGDPFSVLGPHPSPLGRALRVFRPGAERIEALGRAGDILARLERRNGEDLFTGIIPLDEPYLLRMEERGQISITEDPYAFGLLLDGADLSLMAAGMHPHLHRVLGAHVCEHEGLQGVRFTVWAPQARRVSVIGDFNHWDARLHGMRFRHEAGVWELFVPRLAAGAAYKFAIIGADGQRLADRADPMARQTRPPPENVSVVAPALDHAWRDRAWMRGREGRQNIDAAISIYEVHLASWRKAGDGFPDWRFATEHLIAHVKSLGFTHIELLPLAEHPFTGSWGYQPLSLFAPSARYGSPRDFAAFVDACHRANIGVLMDWVPAHFPDDPHGLVRFDGSALYEQREDRMARHPDWNTCIYDYGRREVRNFLAANALYWLEEFHIDGLRVDAVASMLYRDYSRRDGEWSANIHGGRENLEAVELLRHVNELAQARCPGVLMIAEESTSWPGVTKSVREGGLGFSFKWNMGWMNDTLRYMARDPVHRRWHHDELTFGMMYQHAENFVLPLSHDEVVHGKRSLISKMPGSDGEKFSGLRAYLAWMWIHPGKKLLFMGGEFAQWHEWNHDGELDWSLLQDARHAGVSNLVRDLNRIYRHERSLHATDQGGNTFRWLQADDRERSVLAFSRMAKGAPQLVAVANFTPVERPNYMLPAPEDGYWHEIFNSDSQCYGGYDRGNLGGKAATPDACGNPCLELCLPPLSVIVLRHEAA